MAAEWDNLIPDTRDIPSKNGSFHDDFEDKNDRKVELKRTSKSRKKKTEQTSLSDNQDEYSVTQYVMEYTDIFEPSPQKLEFVDIQEGDKISEASDDEIVAHSSEAKTYEHTDMLDSEESEDSSRLPPIDTGVDTFGIDVDLGMNNGIADESEEYDEDLVMDKGGHSTLGNNIETNLGNLVDIEENGKGGNKQIDTQEKGENEQVDVAKVKGEQKQVEKVKHEIKQMEIPKMKSENKQVEKVKSENKQMNTQKVNEMTKQDSKDEENEESGKEEKSDDEKEQVEVVAEDDYSDDTTEVDKLIQDSKVENKIDKKKTKSKMVSSGSQAHEAEPLLNTSQTPSPPETPSPSQTSSPEPQESLQHRKHFTPRDYPGKAVKSIAIGTDDDYLSNEYTKERHARVSPMETQKKTKGSAGKVRQHRNIENGVKAPTKASTPSSTRTPPSTRTPTSSRSHRQANGDTLTHRSKQLRGERGSQSSDAMFFKSRLSQTSKRQPKRHVWLVRDSEIHRLIAEKAALLRRYKEEGITGRIKSKGFPNYSEVDVLGLPSVGFSGRTRDESHQSSLPYGRHPSSKSSHGGYRGGSSSEDEDERTNRLGTKGGKSGTFAVGLAARREQAEKQHEPGDEEEGCELCAAEAREREKHEQKLKELEAAAKAGPHHPRNLMLGIVYSAKFLGSTNLMSPSAPNKAVRLQQAQEAISRIKVPEGEEQPSSDVDLFISTERIKVVSSDNKQPLTDHHLKTISFIADIGTLIVVMARLSTENDSKTWSGKMPDFSPQKEKQEEKTTKVICHVLETSEAQTVAKTVGQAFNIAYHEFLKTNRLNLSEIEDMEYNGILEQQKILGEELSLLADVTKTKEVVIHKKYGESLLLMIVESGWGSMIPTVVIAHMDNKGPVAKSGQLNVGNQILAVNGQSLVGLPLLECQNIIKAQKYEERVAFKVVSCPPTVEISINRPDTKYQLGFSVQNGMICSLMRGGIAERGGVRVGHKIIEMNGESVVAASHHHIVDVLQTTIGELRMKTMPITLYKLLVGLEVPQYL